MISRSTVLQAVLGLVVVVLLMVGITGVALVQPLQCNSREPP